jgi:GntP family gluconate:H+ symporter
MLAIYLLLSILILLVLIAAMKVHPFIALIFVSFLIGLLARMPPLKIADSVQAGFGATLGFIGIVLGLGTLLGKLLDESGGAEQIARTLIGAFGRARVHWAMYVVAFIVGIPVFFQVGFVLLIPLVFTITNELDISALKVGLPVLAGLSVVHGILPPHPAALAAVGIFKADIGKTIVYALVVGLPASILAGPVFATVVGPRLEGFSSVRVLPLSEKRERPAALPGFFTTLFTILLPVILLMLSTYADVALDPSHRSYGAFKFVGNPIVALFIATLVGMYTLGIARGMTPAQILRHADNAFVLIASILLILGAGGAFSRVLVDSGVGAYIAGLAQRLPLNPLVFAWLVSTLIRVSTGSATVAMTTAAGIVAPLTVQTGVSPELMVLAVGGGALMLSHVNDAGFWLIKEYFQMSLRLTFLTWTLLETILGVSILVFTLVLERALR